MISFQNFFSKEDKFLRLLDQSAQQASKSILELLQYLQTPEKLKDPNEFVVARREEKAIAAKISEELCTTLITTLDREDIGELSRALYKIPKTVGKVAERILLAPDHLKGFDLSRHIQLLGKATEILSAMVHELGHGLHVERVKNLNDQLQAVEGDADKALTQMLRLLYTVPSSTVRAVYLKDLLELLEKVFDRCRDAGNVVTQIVLRSC